jgi:deoxycytidylate deaminase
MPEAAQPANDKEKARREVIDSQTQVIAEAAKEFVFGVVGHIGSGTSEVAKSFRDLLGRQSQPYDATILKATEVIERWAKSANLARPDRNATRSVDNAKAWQDLGDEMRRQTKDHAAVAKGLVREIRNTRAAALKVDVVDGQPVIPDGAPRAYILDALRHPAEVNLLRHLYQDAFVLIAVVCDEDIRRTRLSEKLGKPEPKKLDDLMRRDEKDNVKHGQQVAKAFQLADFYVDNTPDRFLYSETHVKLKENPDWNINEELQRLVRIVNHEGVQRPKIEETAMHHAYSAQLRSACLSRQVGAALMDKNGNILATGTNEVPRAGGGVYGEMFHDQQREESIPLDHRCAYRPDKYCSSTREQNVIIDEIIKGIDSIQSLNAMQKAQLQTLLKDGRVGDTIEFSRAVHAEMDALLSAARSGASTIGTRLFVTTYPCHYCARHIISAGVDEVQYIEPYFKSLATRLHSDAIQQRLDGWAPPSSGAEGATTVLFRPFTGVAPRLYHRAFIKDRDLKNDATGDFNVAIPDWGTPWHLRRKSYVQLEAQIVLEA